MQYFHNVSFRVFCKGSEEGEVRTAMEWLSAVDWEKEKLVMERKKATGFSEREILVLSLRLEKRRLVRQFGESLLERLGDEKKVVVQQMESRLDGNIDFFLRFAKAGALEKRLELTDSGDCVHTRLNVAVFPKERSRALEVLQAFFGDKGKSKKN